MNKGGFSWKRAVGITRAKQRISRKTGIPLTKSGRQRKAGRMVTGGGCLVPATFVALILVIGACTPAGPAVEGNVASPAAGTDASATGLATEPAAPTGATTTVTPTSQAIAAPLPVKGATYYSPPGWDGVSDVNCSDFDTQKHAQSFFIGTGGTTTNDPYKLDGDHDGKACETLP